MSTSRTRWVRTCGNSLAANEAEDVVVLPDGRLSGVKDVADGAVF